MTESTGPRPWPGTLDWGGDWCADCGEELARLGFVLRDGGRAGSSPGPRLLVALRDRPTLTHFDPEEVTFWEVHAGRGRLARMDRKTPVPFERPFSWGRIRVTDRIPVTNQFLSFGGSLLTAAPDEHQVYAAFTSRAPIVRWAGHSQGVDPLADEIGSFFARIKVPIDYQPEAEGRVASASPEALYAAFLEHASRRMQAARGLRDADASLTSLVGRERSRLTGDAPAAWREGVGLLDWLELG